jgi:hypothetical protein
MRQIRTLRGGRKATYQPEEVKAAVPVLRALRARKDGLVLVELLLLDRDVDLDDVLPDDAARADVQMAVDAY